MSISVSEQKTAEKIAAKFNLPGKITGCMNSGEISVPYANWGLAALSAGIVARVGISDAPENIYNLPPETATNITSCYNIGTIRGTYVAGVMGYTGTDC